MNLPIISVIIPVRNEEKYIERSVLSVLNQDYPKEKIEIIVCDGVSTDNTLAVVSSISKNHPQVKVLVNKHKTTPYALNLGIKNANGDFIFILGGHAEAEIFFLKECIGIFHQNSKIACVGGILINNNENKTSDIIALVMSSPFGVGSAHFRTGAKSGFVDTVAFGLYKKEVFNIVGLFDTDLIRNQDDEFNYRLIKSGYLIYLTEKTKIVYYVRSSYLKLFRQYYQYGFWKVIVNQKHKTVTSVRQLIPPFLVICIFTGIILMLTGLITEWVFLTFTFIYFTTGYYFALQGCKNLLIATKIVFGFLILHISYGIGYINSAIYIFIFRKKGVYTFHEITR